MSDHSGRRHTAGALDIRNIIGGLIGAYGVILLLVGIVNGDGGPKSADVNSNLYAGIILLVVGVGFLAWARMKPIVVPDDVDKSSLEGPPPGH